ncbi:hypothetical protein V6N12_068239 [Hibiscus sabdariffa]|uniref:Uncharacterized protein n=1 Tax=Hibiscus sabdariffa TaxID=183260 RepID=A0ABR2FQ46_9ROSI
MGNRRRRWCFRSTVRRAVTPITLVSTPSLFVSDQISTRNGTGKGKEDGGGWRLRVFSRWCRMRIEGDDELNGSFEDGGFDEQGGGLRSSRSREIVVMGARNGGDKRSERVMASVINMIERC